jgi:hypothetical protein
MDPGLRRDDVKEGLRETALSIGAGDSPSSDWPLAHPFTLSAWGEGKCAHKSCHHRLHAEDPSISATDAK